MAIKAIFLPGTQVLFEVPRILDTKCQTFFRGHKEDHYIILDYPCYDNGMPLPLKDRMPCIVRFLYEGKVYGFESQILKTTRYPYPFIFISYPESLDCINLRNTERHPIRLKTVYTQQALESTPEGYPIGFMINLSYNGCLLETAESFERKTLLFLTFTLPNQDSVINLGARVKRISQNEDRYHLGLQFIDSDDLNLQKIKAYLDYLKTLQVLT